MTNDPAALGATLAIAEAIRALGRVPSGHLYARLMGHMSLETYMAMLDVLKRAGLIAVDGAHEIRWIGPLATTEQKEIIQ